MEDLIDWMNGQEGPAPALVVHLGAGSGAAISRWQGLPAQRRPAHLVLVEGDAEAAESLHREAAGLSWVRVLATAVAPATGQVDWHRFSLAAVNGPLDGTGLAVYYPRLRRLASTRVNAVALAELLRPILSAPMSEDAPVVLAFDLPGQEFELLESLPEDVLQRCSEIVIRGCKEAPGPGGAPLDTAVASLRRRLFSLAHTEYEREPLWPLAWLRFDRSAFELRRLRAELTVREAQLAELTGDRTRQTEQLRLRDAEREDLLGKVSQAEQHASKTAAALAERDKRVDSLSRDHSSLQAQLQERAAETEALRASLTQMEQQKAELTATLAERDAQIAELSKSREWHRRVGTERESRIEAITSEHNQLRESHAALTSQVEALRLAAGQAQEQQGRAHQLAQELEGTREEASKLKAQRDEVQRASTEFKRGLAASRTQVAMKQRRIDELEAELQQLRRSQGSLDEEVARAEGQLDLIKDLLLLTPQSHAA